MERSPKTIQVHMCAWVTTRDAANNIFSHNPRGAILKAELDLSSTHTTFPYETMVMIHSSVAVG